MHSEDTKADSSISEPAAGAIGPIPEQLHGCKNTLITRNRELRCNPLQQSTFEFGPETVQKWSNFAKLD
jgi:hypothetical protein